MKKKPKNRELIPRKRAAARKRSVTAGSGGKKAAQSGGWDAYGIRFDPKGRMLIGDPNLAREVGSFICDHPDFAIVLADRPRTPPGPNPVDENCGCKAFDLRLQGIRKEPGRRIAGPSSPRPGP